MELYKIASITLALVFTTTSASAQNCSNRVYSSGVYEQAVYEQAVPIVIEQVKEVPFVIEKIREVPVIIEQVIPVQQFSNYRTEPFNTNKLVNQIIALQKSAEEGNEKLRVNTLELLSKIADAPTPQEIEARGAAVEKIIRAALKGINPPESEDEASPLPLLIETCGKCHIENNKGGFTLTTDQESLVRAMSALSTKEMPPSDIPSDVRVELLNELIQFGLNE